MCCPDFVLQVMLEVPDEPPTAQPLPATPQPPGDEGKVMTSLGDPIDLGVLFYIVHFVASLFAISA